MLAVGAFTPDLGRAALGVVLLAIMLLVSLSASSPSASHAAIVLAVLLAAGTAGGAAVGARIEHAGHLLPVAIVSSLADAISVLTPGAPSDVVADTPALLSVLAISWPMPGTSDVVAILGVGDIAFVGIYFAAAHKFGLPLGRTAIALAIGLAAAAVVVAATSLPIPALPFLGAAMVSAHPAARKIPEKDRRTAIIGLVVLILLVAALVLSRRSG